MLLSSNANIIVTNNNKNIIHIDYTKLVNNNPNSN